MNKNQNECIDRTNTQTPDLLPKASRAQSHKSHKSQNIPNVPVLENYRFPHIQQSINSITNPPSVVHRNLFNHSELLRRPHCGGQWACEGVVASAVCSTAVYYRRRGAAAPGRLLAVSGGIQKHAVNQSTHAAATPSSQPSLSGRTTKRWLFFGEFSRGAERPCTVNDRHLSSSSISQSIPPQNA